MLSSGRQLTDISTGSVLLLQVPRTNDKKELAAEQMFAALHGLLTRPKSRGVFGRHINERISFEIAVANKRIGFYVWVPNGLVEYVEEQIYAQYPTVQISEVDDYTMSDSEYYEYGTSLKFTANQALPIKTFPSFEVDPLASITATLAQLDESEQAWIQFVMRPAQPRWYKQSEKFAASQRGRSFRQSGSGAGIANMLWTPPSGVSATTAKLADYETTRAGAAELKSQKIAYEITARIMYRRKKSDEQVQMRLQAITASFKQFNTTYLNGFTYSPIAGGASFLKAFRQRNISNPSFICNIEEVASLFHLPHTNVETPNILWANAKTAEPPANLPIVTDASHGSISPVAVTNFRGHRSMFGLRRSDRGRHLYVIGQTGVGKTGLLELLTISDIYSPYGFAVIDPHGDYAVDILKRIPANRIKDVVYFNPADMDFPIAFNPMEVTDDKLKTHTASELIGVLKRMFDSWGPRLEYILRYSILALLEYPNATMLDITRILTDKKFRAEVLEHVNDPVVRNFWLLEFASWNDKFAAEAISPVLNKVGAFTANPIVRNIIGQSRSSFSIRQIMDKRKILIVNLSKGLIGEDNASLLGSLLVAKIQMAAMSRADSPVEERIPFYLYVDEFQNFATESFAVILSEARKYGLNLTVANQYISQMSQEVREAVFGNVGSIVAFRTSADDARVTQKYFEPQFEDRDLVHMHNRDFAISMIIEGEKISAFSATTLGLPNFGADNSAEIIINSRNLYAYKRDRVESEMQQRFKIPQKSNHTADNRRAAEPARPISYRQNFDIQNKLSRTALLSKEIFKPKRKRTRRKPKTDHTRTITSFSNGSETVIQLR